MATPAQVDAILAGAKSTLSKANDYEKTLPKVSPQPAPAPSKNEYSNAPYKMAKKPLTGIKKEASDAGTGIKWRMQQAEALKQ
jgi:hypothetical protein